MLFRSISNFERANIINIIKHSAEFAVVGFVDLKNIYIYMQKTRAHQDDIDRRMKFLLRCDSDCIIGSANEFA